MTLIGIKCFKSKPLATPPFLEKEKTRFSEKNAQEEMAKFDIKVDQSCTSSGFVKFNNVFQFHIFPGGGKCEVECIRPENMSHAPHSPFNKAKKDQGPI
jgi:hypothetical protein